MMLKHVWDGNYNDWNVYTTVSKKSCRDGSICAFKHLSELKFGSILQFVFTNNDLHVVIDTFHYLPASILDHVRPASILDHVRPPTHAEMTVSACSSISQFVYCVKKLALTNSNSSYITFCQMCN